MASSGPMEADKATGEPSSPQEIANVSKKSSTEHLSSTPLEMTDLASKAQTESAVLSTPTQPEPPSQREHDPQTTSTDSGAHASTTTPGSPPRFDRSHSTAIGPSSDQPVPVPKDTGFIGPTLIITLLLTNGARHPFKLDQKYLTKRNVNVQDNDPYNLSIYTLKELILREWRDEWEQRPSSPSSIRLISFGKLLDDKSPLKDSKFSHDSPNVVHMTVRPQEIVDEEDAKGAKSAFSARDREGSERSPGCRCVIL